MSSYFFILAGAFEMSGILLFNKPFRVLSQFTDDAGRKTLSDYLNAPGFRPAGRLDYDSEGLLLLTADGVLQQQITSPEHKLWKTYYVQVEGEPDQRALEQLTRGVALKDGLTRPARVSRIATPDLWMRDPPIRVRKTVPDSWLQIAIHEGRNRQVRRMTAAVGHPTLRLVRMTIGQWKVDGLSPGHFIELEARMPVKNRRGRR